ncbi:alcohol dehydrogenase [Trametopsis cervina]|nr:alcohol dehydrogenase [Trametopsis cervina]
MALTRNPTLVYVSEPANGAPIDANAHFKVINRDIDLENIPLCGGVLVKTLVVSSDPYLRYRFRDPAIQLFVPPVQLGFPVDSSGIGKILRSEDPAFKPGDVVIGYLNFSEYSVYPYLAPHFYKRPIQKIDIHPRLSYSTYMGVLGLPGHAAYSGWKAYYRFAQAHTMYVSSGASTVGTFIIEYTKLRAPHIKIVASAGTGHKIEYMKASGADVTFNYKTTKPSEILSEHGPIDIYWDNVGGEAAEAALMNMADDGLIVACGSISTISGAFPMLNWEEIFKRRLTVQGFVCYHDPLVTPMKTFFPEIVPLVVEGKLSCREHRYTGIEHAAKALVDVITGENIGKAVIIVADE